MLVRRWPGALLLSALILSGLACHGTGSRRATAPEATLSGAIDSGGTIAETPPPASVTYVDRHPILSKPKEYWDDGGENKIVKAARATFIGVPYGLYGEMKQIVVGVPPTTR
jgi:hypothetical protein